MGDTQKQIESLSKSGKVLLDTLLYGKDKTKALMSREDNTCSYSVAELSELNNVSLATTNRALAELSKADFITKVYIRTIDNYNGVVSHQHTLTKLTQVIQVNPSKFYSYRADELRLNQLIYAIKNIDDARSHRKSEHKQLSNIDPETGELLDGYKGYYDTSEQSNKSTSVRKNGSRGTDQQPSRSRRKGMFNIIDSVIADLPEMMSKVEAPLTQTAKRHLKSLGLEPVKQRAFDNSQYKRFIETSPFYNPTDD